MFPNRVCFGDTHLHTSYSTDAVNNQEIQIMRLIKLLPILILSLTGAMAMAKDNDKNKFDDVNCSTLDSDKLRKECRQRKYGSNDGKKVDCSKLDNDKLRRECKQEKWN
jgi:hypothetical protein